MHKKLLSEITGNWYVLILDEEITIEEIVDANNKELFGCLFDGARNTIYEKIHILMHADDHADDSVYQGESSL